MSTQEKTTRSNVETVRELMRRWDAGWAARDARQLADMMADDATWEDPILARPISGKHELQRYFEAVLRSFPDIEVRQEEIFVDVDDDSRFASRFVLRGTFRETLDSAGYAAFPIAATGDRVEVTGVGTGSLRD